MSRRVPTVTQVTQTECGLCCCIAVMRYWGRSEDFFTVRQDLEAGRDGLGAKQLSDFLRSRGMQTKAFRVKSLDALAQFTAPVILYWEDYHFLVLEKFDGRTATVMDPAVGRRRLTREELAAGFSDIVIAAEPGPGFARQHQAATKDWRTVPLFAERSVARIALVAVLSLSGYLAVLGIPALTKWAVDRQTQWQDLSDISLVAGAVGVAALGYLLLWLMRVAVLSSLIAVMGRHLMSHTFRKLLSLPYKFFNTRQPGELLFRLNTVNAVRDLLSSRIAQGILDIGTLVCISVYLFIAEWRIGLMATVLFALNAVYLWATRTRVKEVTDAEMSQLGRSQSTQLDAIVSIPTIKMGGYAQQFADEWATVYTSSLDAMKKRMRLQQGWIAGVATTTQMFGPMVLLLASLYFVSHGIVSLGSAIAIQSVSATYFSMTTSVFQMFTEFTEASRYMARLSDITAHESEDSGGRIRKLDDASITLREVQFRYTRHAAPVIDGVSLHIPAGSRVALVGASGSGKSTLGRLVCGLHDPAGGAIELGGRAMPEYDKDFLRRQIGYIPQEVHLHNRTILENLTLGQDISPETVRAYCSEVGILDFVDALPMGLKTLVSELGANFSGGQRQRLAIVRTLLQKPEIIVMDEATASLDTINERRVTKLIEESGATQVIIAHRLATIRNADCIYVLDDGRVTEYGTHQQLLDNQATYAALYAEADAPTFLGETA
ncbi:peptidase domain-containing ABC transporter [Streptomyces platensis]|uniref:Lactococcin-G-processing and transport ATP-binding protein LagD n=1 Tax=Streptomyces platensis TaxID=58346 RepID=A0AAE6NI25_STRPT|nr:peptidase domain-containing ABC transporter [Streptomyces platensis]OSY36224.1 Lactococcin-G-processing and transport ATP-binding protein LagD [Streptomyces platensis]QEV53008.1 peptidase domain-containing ABC transporter [Streptomyces platensis]